MKTLAIISTVIAILLIGFIIGVLNTDTPNFLGGFDNFYFEATNSKVFVYTTAASSTANPVLEPNTQRTNSMICHVSGSYPVFLHQMADNSTTTGVVVASGVMLQSSSTAADCQDFPGFRGYMFAISSGTATLSVSEWE